MNALSMTLAEIAAATGGNVIADDDTAVVTGITVDSRAVQPGDLFVAVAGERFDGHDFVPAALAAGAVGALVERGRDVSGPAIEIDDTFTALRDLAAHHRGRLSQRVVAITGSTGKTTTKDLLAAALPDSWGSPRSFNNEIGVPLTVLRTPPAARFAVIEVGSRGVGHIAFLAPAVQPDVAVITNLGTVHLETFGTVDRLVAAKFELVEALTPDGVAVLPAEDARLTSRQHAAETVTFGVETEATVVARDVALDDRGIPTFVLETPAGTAKVTVPIPGAVQAANSAAAVAAGLALEVPLQTLAEGLERAAGSAWRMEVHAGRYVVVNDAYNANPQSVEAALRTVTAMPGRHLAVLGQMAELGPVSDSEHRRIGALARELGFASVIVVGDAALLAEGAGDIALRVPDAAAAVDAALERIHDGDVVLVKASRSIGLEAVAEPLIAASKGGDA